ncbi:tyrosine--tRNA ligase [Vibrio japonicus]|uniref:Tyrosine--tRNA ligase n=1 Tax=Vibrio japonicus TaxID=1824638 RepID=A0ABY5LLF6_9VIBR|nr:tyrosine--tRNA ligase [Vibrio japonicus]UUM32924.1 tyrosine--tRNA ligase [Vibrio japonicus]
MKPTLIHDLEQRGLIAQTTHLEELKQQLSTPQVVYCGFDPTAGSLHIGHLVPLVMLKRFQNAGHSPIALIGGATGMIGDPSFKATERSLNTEQTVNGWVDQLSNQIRIVMDKHSVSPLTIVNNADWISNINVIQFLRDIGKHFSVNAMINRESVKQRLQRPDQGISFTEFSYALLQAYDFAHLNKEYGCKLQIGGSDQWGNIVSGIDLTRRLNNDNVFGLTLPLITKSDGVKFGKTEGGAVWLDAEKTSPYAFYQFWLNTTDDDVYRFLRYYTFLSVEQIENIEQQDKESEGKPQAQRILAEQVTQFVHGEEGLASAQRITQALFDGDLKTLNQSEISQLELDGLPSYQVEATLDMAEVLVTCNLAKSKRIARELMTSSAIRINGELATEGGLDQQFALFDKYWIVQRGKKAFRLLSR